MIVGGVAPFLPPGHGSLEVNSPLSDLDEGVTV
jgi:hypothetical protein